MYRLTNDVDRFKNFFHSSYNFSFYKQVVNDGIDKTSIKDLVDFLKSACGCGDLYNMKVVVGYINQWDIKLVHG